MPDLNASQTIMLIIGKPSSIVITQNIWSIRYGVAKCTCLYFVEHEQLLTLRINKVSIFMLEWMKHAYKILIQHSYTSAKMSHYNGTTRISWKLKSLRHVNSCEFSAEPLTQTFQWGRGVGLNSFQELALIFSWRVGLKIQQKGSHESFWGGGGLAWIHSKSWP